MQSIYVPVITKEYRWHLDGQVFSVFQAIHRFPNNWGASVVTLDRDILAQTPLLTLFYVSENGPYEILPIYFPDDGNSTWYIDKSDDATGYLQESEIVAQLDKIATRPPRR